MGTSTQKYASTKRRRDERTRQGQLGEGAAGQTAVVWFLIGNATYYAVAIALAYALKDNRAFCKYLCPVSVPLKLTSRFSLLKIGGADKCDDCGACVKTCPMDCELKLKSEPLTLQK